MSRRDRSLHRLARGLIRTPRTARHQTPLRKSESPLLRRPRPARPVIHWEHRLPPRESASMPELRWKEHEFLEVLSVLPTNTDDVEYVFDVTKDGARLIVTVWPCESVIGIFL